MQGLCLIETSKKPEKFSLLFCTQVLRMDQKRGMAGSEMRWLNGCKIYHRLGKGLCAGLLLRHQGRLYSLLWRALEIKPFKQVFFGTSRDPIWC